MKCLRCGYCCWALMVILPDGTPKMSDEKCKYFEWDGEKAICKIHGQTFMLEGHEYKWEETPCGRHDQISRSPDDDCRMGAHCRDSVSYKKRLETAPKLRPEEPRNEQYDKDSA